MPRVAFFCLSSSLAHAGRVARLANALDARGSVDAELRRKTRRLRHTSRSKGLKTYLGTVVVFPGGLEDELDPAAIRVDYGLMSLIPGQGDGCATLRNGEDTPVLLETGEEVQFCAWLPEDTHEGMVEIGIEAALEGQTAIETVGSLSESATPRLGDRGMCEWGRCF